MEQNHLCNFGKGILNLDQVGLKQKFTDAGRLTKLEPFAQVSLIFILGMCIHMYIQRFGCISTAKAFFF